LAAAGATELADGDGASAELRRADAELEHGLALLTGGASAVSVLGARL
jgi:hypothetical protein